MTYYTKNDKDELTEVNVDDMFKDRHERWVSTESKKVREEVEATIRDELKPAIEQEVEDRVKGELQPKLDEAVKNAEKLQIQVHQKAIAAEYGFKPETEQFLGGGTEEEMRKAADVLKASFAGGGMSAPDKTTSTGKSAVQERTGIQVTI